MYNTLMQNNVFFALFLGGGGSVSSKWKLNKWRTKEDIIGFLKKKEKKKHMLCLTVMSFKK